MAELNEQDIKLKNAISERIRQLREKTGLTQSEFANQHDLDRQLLNRWESSNNKRGINIYTVQRFCNMIDIPLKHFFDSTIFD